MVYIHAIYMFSKIFIVVYARLLVARNHILHCLLVGWSDGPSVIFWCNILGVLRVTRSYLFCSLLNACNCAGCKSIEQEGVGLLKVEAAE